jgi:hypothetical protein
MVEKNSVDLYKDARLVLIKIRYLWWIGNSYVEGVSDLQKSNSNNFVSMELLSAQAIELLLKSYLGSKICIDNKEKDQSLIESLVDKMFRGFGHNIENLLNQDSDLKNQLKILSVEKVNNGFVSDYRITLKNKHILSFKELESVRYGAFAKNVNIVNGFLEKDQIVFLQELSKFIHDKISDCTTHLKQKTA